jgi:hypothetical protein
MTTFTTTCAAGLQIGDVISYPVYLSRWARLWRVIRYMRHNMPPEPRRFWRISAVSGNVCLAEEDMV